MESLFRVYDFGTGFTFQFIKTFDKNSEEMCLFKVNRYVFEWDDASTGSKWFLPSYSEFKSLTVIMASEDMLHKLDLWHRDSTCSDESKWGIRPVKHTINFKNNGSKKRVHPKLLSVKRKIK